MAKRYWLPIALTIGTVMSSSFHSADKRTHRKVLLVGFLFCAAFVAISLFARSQPDADYVLIKADKQVRSAGKPPAAN
jgi:hypothetical protein